MIRWKRSWPELSEDPAVDVLPASNGEFIPPSSTAEERAIMELQDREIERYRRRIGMSRRDFVRTAMAFSIGFWAIDQVRGGQFGSYAGAHNTATTAACDLEWADNPDPYATLLNLPGEFIFDVQSHHVESDGMWRITNPGFEAFFAAIWAQAGPVTGARPGIRSGGSTDLGSSNFIVRGSGAGELDPIENLSRYHYLKELFLDSATTMTVLSAVPAAPELNQPLPIGKAVETVLKVNELAGIDVKLTPEKARTIMHAFVMPNRGAFGAVSSVAGQKPVFMDEEFALMTERAHTLQPFLRAWKTYPAWGDIPYASGWYFDDPLVGQPFIEHVLKVSAETGMPPIVATHKGFALPAFDQRAASPRDIGPAASRNFDLSTGKGIIFIVYHSGYDNEPMADYRGDDKVSSADRTVDSLIKSLRENDWDATRFRTWNGFGNVPNVYAEIGSTWRSVMRDPNAAAHLLGKLIKYVGPKRICWGTDSLWFGSPQSEIVALRKLQFSNELNQRYGLAAGIDSDADDPGNVDTRDGSRYTASHPNAARVPGWPTDGKPHPERSIRNWIFGRAAAQAYGVDADLHLNDRKPRTQGGHAIACDDVQKIRDGYILNQGTPRETVPMASNSIHGPRTPRELSKLRKEQPWAP